MIPASRLSRSKDSEVMLKRKANLLLEKVQELAVSQTPFVPWRKEQALCL